MIVRLRQLEHGSVVSPVALAQLFSGTFAEERDWMAVGGDHLLLLDACGTECRRQPATRMLPRGRSSLWHTYRVGFSP
jgi:hypothetical protein